MHKKQLEYTCKDLISDILNCLVLHTINYEVNGWLTGWATGESNWKTNKPWRTYTIIIDVDRHWKLGILTILFQTWNGSILQDWWW